MTRRAVDQAAIVNRWRSIADMLAEAVQRLLDAPTSGAGSFAERQAVEIDAIDALAKYKEGVDA